jgi:hypothetical protein
MSTTTDPILDAIAAIESQEAGERLSYRRAAEIFKVDRRTLARRHKGQTQSYAAAAKARQLLNPQQELELVKYIERSAKRGLPPTREMVQNFASAVAKWEVSESWVTRFLHRHDRDLTSKWTVGMDRVRHIADSPERYKAYFTLLHSKIQQYKVEAEDIYNMDEKGFVIGKTTRSKRIFSKASWMAKETTAALQDGNREFITCIACVCADGTALPPALIFMGNSGVQSGWVEDVLVGEHQVFIGNSPSGWSNNDLGLAWLEQVFDRASKDKSRRRWRLLILDGHGSHVTRDFIEYCDANKILLAIFPPHSTHSLQPLDVVLFSPLSTAYSNELTKHLHRSQGLIGVKKRDFFPIFWAAWNTTFKRATILKSFEATGVMPMNAEIVLQRFNNHSAQQDGDAEIGEHGNGDTWDQLRNLFESAVTNRAGVEAKRLKGSLHSLQVQNKLLHRENEGLRDALYTKKKHKRQSKTLDLQQRKEYHSGAIFWSPKKIREARAREAVKQQEEEAEKLRKADNKQLKESALLYKKQLQEAAKEA